MKELTKNPSRINYLSNEMKTIVLVLNLARDFSFGTTSPVRRGWQPLPSC